MNDKDESARLRAVFGGFARACRLERDRLARSRLAAEDRRFESMSPERRAADALATRLIAAAARR